MAYEIAFDESVSCYFVEWTGTVDGDEWRSVYPALAASPWFRPGLIGLHDARPAEFRLDRSEMQRIANLHEMTDAIFGAGRVAAVVGDDRTFALIQSFNAIASNLERSRRVFMMDDQAAKEWLGLPAGYRGPFDVPEGPTE